MLITLLSLLIVSHGRGNDNPIAKTIRVLYQYDHLFTGYLYGFAFCLYTIPIWISNILVLELYLISFFTQNINNNGEEEKRRKGTSDVCDS